MASDQPVPDRRLYDIRKDSIDHTHLVDRNIESAISGTHPLVVPWVSGDECADGDLIVVLSLGNRLSFCLLSLVPDV
jgi:hypothetical protein